MRTKVCHILNILGISTMLVSFVSGAQDCVMTPTQVSVYLNRWESFLHNRQKKLFLQSDCANYKYPHADANLGMLCMHMSSMTGCSLRKQCKSVRSNLIDFFLFFSYVFFCSYSPTSCQKFYIICPGRGQGIAVQFILAFGGRV